MARLSVMTAGPVQGHGQGQRVLVDTSSIADAVMQVIVPQQAVRLMQRALKYQRAGCGATADRRRQC